MADMAGSRAVALIGPVWSSVSKIADSSKALTDRFTGMIASLPGVGRRLLEDGAAGEARAPTVGEMLHGRALKQAGGGGGGGLLGQIVQGIADGINAAAAAIPEVIPGLPANVTVPFLPQLLPNGSSNPLFNAIEEVTNTIETQIINPTGCPIYCIDLRNETWWADAEAGEPAPRA
jgi:hypothetical protein